MCPSGCFVPFPTESTNHNPNNYYIQNIFEKSIRLRASLIFFTRGNSQQISRAEDACGQYQISEILFQQQINPCQPDGCSVLFQITIVYVIE